MSTKKQSFVLYNDLIDTIDELTDEQAGKLLKMILAKVNDRKIPECDKLLKLVFIPIEKSLDRDLKKYENKLQERSNAGRAGNLKKHYPDLYEDFKKGKLDLNEAFELAKDRKTSHSENSIANVADSDSDSVTDNERVSVSENDSFSDSKGKKEKIKIDKYSSVEFIKDFLEIRRQYGEEPIKLASLNEKEELAFENYKKHYSRQEFKKAITALFWQEPKVYEQALMRPKHFLENMDTYLTCYNSEERHLYSKINVGPKRNNGSSNIPIG